MVRKNIFKIINAFPSDLTHEERKIQILAMWALIPFFLVLSYVWFGILIKLNFIPFFLAFCTMLIGMTILIYYWDTLDSKYGLRPVKSLFALSYQGYVILLLCFSPVFFFLGLALGLTTNNIWFGLGGAVAIVYPILGMILRIKTFNDDSITFSRKVIIHNDPKRRSKVPKAALPNIKGNLPSGDRKITETVKGFGYMPLAYWILSVMLGLYTTGSGFSDIHLYFIKGSTSLEAAIFIIILGLIVQSVYIFPDKLNKFSPIDLRDKTGFGLMVLLVFVLFGISQWLIGIVIALTS